MASIILSYSALLPFFASTSTSTLLKGRDIDRPILDSYDYIVVGCGISGLVVSNRLSEDPDRTVLCIEAGQADHYETVIQYPVYVGQDIGGPYDWHLSTTPQIQLDGAARPMPQGKVVGGGSILNAMVWNRGGADDYDAWEELGNPGWSWAGMLPYFKKSETYTPVGSPDDAREYSINYNPDVHGFNGPVQVSYPRYIYPQSANLFEAHNNLGIPTQFDVNDGTSAGPAFTPQDIDPNNQTRCDARRAYFDPYAHRDNFHIITGQHVTRVIVEGVANSSQVSHPSPGGNENGNGQSDDTTNEGFGFGPEGSTPPGTGSKMRRQNLGSQGLRIEGVEFAPNASTPRQTVYATREVIVAAGSLHSTQLLQLSGIGPRSLLEQFQIPVAVDLPGVGHNLQDHCLVGTFYPYNNASYPSPMELTANATYNAEARQEYETSKTGPWTAGAPDALAFNPLSLITNNAGVIIANASRQRPTDFLLPNLDSTIVNGYAAQKRNLVSRYGRRNVAAYEIINNNAGSLTVSVMHPFSRGTCHISSADPFQPPTIDPRWLTNPVDRQVLVEALFFNRRLLAEPSMQELRPAQFVPRLEATEAAINTVINGGIRTEFHPSGTLSMLPFDQGGVVDPRLIVYGTQNLRVVDASIFPLIPAAHLQAVVYGVAEKAADIIKADNLLPSGGSGSTSSSPVSEGLSSSEAVSGVEGTETASLIVGSNTHDTDVASSPETSLTPTASTARTPGSEAPSDNLATTTSTTPVITLTHQPSSATSRPGDQVYSITDLPQLSRSVASVLTSAGVPSSIATSPAPVIIGSPPEGSSPTSTSSATDAQSSRAAIDAILRWLLEFFHFDRK